MWLLNEALIRLFQRRGLFVDFRRKRAHFERTLEGERTVQYRARLRMATRTVVRERRSNTTNKVAYWEHQAVEFRFKRYGPTWALHLLPTYVFTTDGLRDTLPGTRSGRLATSRLSREYNPQVDAHLIFWAAVLAGEDPEIRLDVAPAPPLLLRTSAARCVIPAVDAVEADVVAVSLEEVVEEPWAEDEEELEGDVDDAGN